MIFVTSISMNKCTGQAPIEKASTEQFVWINSPSSTVLSFQCLFLAEDASDVTISAVLTNHNTAYMPFRRSTAFVNM